jgi:hypothetical protein
MSQHRSLRAASTLGGKRKAGDRITGLRKTKPEA